jgi:hypothetical protein
MIAQAEMERVLLDLRTEYRSYYIPALPQILLCPPIARRRSAACQPQPATFVLSTFEMRGIHISVLWFAILTMYDDILSRGWDEAGTKLGRSCDEAGRPAALTCLFWDSGVGGARQNYLKIC